MTDTPRPSAPSWVTSLGALVALVVAALSYASVDGAQREAQRRTDDALRQLHQAQDDQRKELKDDLRHEVQVACHCTTGDRGP